MFRKYVSENKLGEIFETTFKDITTIHAGGRIECCFRALNMKTLIEAMRFIYKNKIKHIIIGKGSNVLPSDNDYDGVVILLDGVEYDEIEYHNGYISVSSLYPTSRLATTLREKKLGNLAHLAMIPGLVGGAIYNNSGAFNDSISSSVIDVTYLDSDGVIRTKSYDDCYFGYRKSIFQRCRSFIISTRLKVNNMSTDNIIEDMRKRRIKAQPINCYTMGSVFKNNPLIPAWKIIDALELRGFGIGGAQISEKHANFIVNNGDCLCRDIKNLIDLIETRSKLELGISLVLEITVLDY